jgi:uncharacterized NAD-dependent epimerase/dehydratase family protein
MERICMLDPTQPIALYMEGNLTGPFAKMGLGVLRYSPNPIVAVIDSSFAGRSTDEFGVPRAVPIVASVADAVSLGASAMILGIAPPGGLIPNAWYADIDAAVSAGLSVVNGLHDLLGPRYPVLAEGQFIWDIRIEPRGLKTASALAAGLQNKRLLLVGTDMAVGKMTAGLEIHSGALRRGIRSAFVATGQIGITITGAGIPLDAIRVDYASGAVEGEVLRYADSELIVIEGQGSLVHPASTATLPLLRGSCPTHLVMCVRAGQTALRTHEHVAIPPLGDLIRLYETLARTLGTFPLPRTIGLAVNTAHLSDAEAARETARLAEEVGLPAVDPIRDGVDSLLDALG